MVRPRLRHALVACSLAACGRVGFEPAADAVSPDAPPPATPALVAMSGGPVPGGMTTLSIPIAPVTPGILLVVAVVSHGGSSVQSVVDSQGTPLTPTGAGISMTVGSDLWYTAPTAPIASVTVTLAGTDGFDAWAAEFSGVEAGPPRTTARGCLQYPPSFVSAPGVTIEPGELVFSLTMFEYPVYIAKLLPPFTGFEAFDGNGAGYYVPDAPGS